MNDGVPYRELEIFTDVRVQAHDVDILDSLILACFIMETHGLGSTPVQGISSIQRALFYYRMCEQLGFLFHYSRGVNFALPSYSDLISCLCYLLESCHHAFMTIGQSLATRRANVSKRLARVSVVIATEKFVHRPGLRTVPIHAEIWEFW